MPGAPAAHRRPHDLLEDDPEQRRGRDRERDPEHQRQPPGDVDQVRHVGAEGEEVAVGEVDQLEDPVDERQADRAEGVDRAQREAVEPALRDVVDAVVENQDGDDVGEHDRGERGRPAFDRDHRGDRERVDREQQDPLAGGVREAVGKHQDEVEEEDADRRLEREGRLVRPADRVREALAE